MQVSQETIGLRTGGERLRSDASASGARSGSDGAHVSGARAAALLAERLVRTRVPVACAARLRNSCAHLRMCPPHGTGARISTNITYSYNARARVPAPHTGSPTAISYWSSGVRAGQ